MFVNAGIDARLVDGNAYPYFEIKDRRDFANLRSLDKADTNGYHQLIVATTEEEMRGVDLRAPIKGISLVIAKSFSCQRNAD